MQPSAPELARRLARRAEDVCRHYLPAGRLEGGYWLVGDVRNSPGRSMYVRLKGPDSGQGAAGKWTDAATGEHGDLLDIIRERERLTTFRDTAAEARRFLDEPSSQDRATSRRTRASLRHSPESARRLFSMSVPISVTLAELYLRRRGIVALRDTEYLRFHPACFYRPGDGNPLETWPAMVAAVTNLSGCILGAHRTYLAPSPDNFARDGKAPVTTPRRAMGNLLGNAVRFGAASDIMAAGEGIETVLSLRSALPGMPIMAALSAAHLGAVLFPPALVRLYVARDNDTAGHDACERLTARAHEAGIALHILVPCGNDFNEDLRAHGLDDLRKSLREQLTKRDACRFIA